jgi:hypothetical protein
MANPIQGLVDFVQAQKPYHTKILEILVNYVHEDEVNVEFTEQLLTNIGIVFDTDLADDSGDLESIVELCPRGWGDGWDQSSQFLVTHAQAGSNLLFIVGDVTGSLTLGSVFEVRDPDGIEPTVQYTASFPPPVYDTATDRTVVTVGTTFTTEYFVGPAPVDNTTTATGAFLIYEPPTYTVEFTAAANLITVTGPNINPDDFQAGFAVEIRNETGNPDFNQRYQIAVPFITSATEIQLFCSTNVLADGLLTDGQLVFGGYGYDEPSYCPSPDMTVVRPVFVESLDIQTLDATGTTPLFQYFILGADSGTDTFVVEGDARSDLVASFEVILALAPPYSSFGPYTSGANNGTYTVASVTYDPVSNRSAIVTNESITDDTPTGFIVPD